MRTYSGWAPADVTSFQNYLVNIYYPMQHDFLVNHNNAYITNYWANWDLANIEGMMAIGIFADRQDIYDEAVNYLTTGRVPDDVVRLRTQVKFLPNPIEDSLDCSECPDRLWKEFFIRAEHVAEGICVARIILLGKLRCEHDEVVLLPVNGSNVASFLSGAAAPMHEKYHSSAAFDPIRSVIPDCNLRGWISKRGVEDEITNRIPEQFLIAR